jgi:hypothetical protein
MVLGVINLSCLIIKKYLKLDLYDNDYHLHLIIKQVLFPQLFN